MGKLTSIALKNAKSGVLQDGDGLFIRRTQTGGQWYFRYSRLGKRRDMGLGSYPGLSLAEARQERDRWRAVLRGGQDPIDARRAGQDAEKRAQEEQRPTLARLVQMTLEARKARLRGGGARGRWMSPLEVHLIPKLGGKPVDEITAQDFVDVLRPIWWEKHPTAEKVFQRARMALQYGKVADFGCDPVTIERAAHILGDVAHQTQHIAATPWQDIPALYERLPTTSAGQCLRFMILTLVRMDGCRRCRLSEIDDDLWTVPADRIKGNEGKVQAFRVPLSRAAIAVALDQAQYFDDLIFPGIRGAALSSTALEKCLNEMGEAGRPHGFRTSFRTWAQDTGIDFQVAETILGHSIGGTVERSYARSDLLERRRPVMESWARFVTGAESAGVVRINKRRH